MFLELLQIYIPPKYSRKDFPASPAKSVQMEEQPMVTVTGKFISDRPTCKKGKLERGKSRG